MTFLAGVFAGASLAAFSVGLLLLAAEEEESEAERRSREKARAIEDRFRRPRVRDGALITTRASTEEEAWRKLIERS